MVQGKAGYGKRFLFNLMRNYSAEYLGEDSIEVLAPTGITANNTSGSTYHSFLKLYKALYLFLKEET